MRLVIPGSRPEMNSNLLHFKLFHEALKKFTSNVKKRKSNLDLYRLAVKNVSILGTILFQYTPQINFTELLVLLNFWGVYCIPIGDWGTIEVE